MGLFDKKTKSGDSEPKQSEDNLRVIEINERPRICCIDIQKEVENSLKSVGFNIYSGTPGSKIEVPNSTRRDNHQVLLYFNFPSNLHEYDIIILDLDYSDTIPYKNEEHVKIKHTGKSSISLLSSYPETLFNPRPLSSLILKNKLHQIGNRPHMILAFTAADYETEYETVKITEGYSERQGIEKHGIYSFVNYCPLSEPKYGKEITVCNINEDLRNLLESLKPQTIYNQTFHHPTNWENGKNVPDQNWVPLLKNSNNDIVSICKFTESSIVLYLPQFESKRKFLNEFLSKIAPSISPELFPFSTTFSWKENKDYWLPNHKNLLDEKKSIKVEYDKKLESKDDEIFRNGKKYSFLHEILTETGDKLANSLIEYLKWLGFKNIIYVDEQETDTKVLEEDIQIELDEGLLIIECKGIGGTSTDSDCSQISKIKHRRCKERNRFDVFALYVVNHQRYLPPLNRQNPPFTENQVQDAINDERGLLSTWQLFNLYFEIENGILTKNEAQQEILKFGLVTFKPKNLFLIDEPSEILKQGMVCIVNIENTELNIGEELLVEKNGQFQKATIEGIQLEDKPVSSASSGEVGILLDSPIKKKSKLWKKGSS